MVEMAPFGDHYVLYGVGALVGGEPFAHYDREAAAEVPLYPSYLDFDLADDAFDAAVGELQDKKAALAAARGSARRSARQRRALSGQLKALEQRETLLIRQQERTAEYYEDWDRRHMLAGKLQLLEDVANRLGGRRYDLSRPEDRRALRGRLQTFIRPEARAVLLEIARAYGQVFDRPLPVTSLVRSYRYQSVLRRTNRNATAIDTPPHSTGLAFDLMTRFMSAAEQEYLMAIVARLEDEGRWRRCARATATTCTCSRSPTACGRPRRRSHARWSWWRPGPRRGRHGSHAPRPQRRPPWASHLRRRACRGRRFRASPRYLARCSVSIITTPEPTSGGSGMTSPRLTTSRTRPFTATRAPWRGAPRLVTTHSVPVPSSI
jgi:hypothetical protein